MAFTGQQYAQMLRNVKARINQKNDEVKKLKAQEAEIKKRLESILSMQGQKSAKFEGVGTVTISTKEYASIKNYEKVAEFIFNGMKEAKSNGLPLHDVLNILQKTPKKQSVLEFFELGYSPDDLGIEIGEKSELKFTVTK